MAANTPRHLMIGDSRLFQERSTVPEDCSENRRVTEL